MKRHIIPFAVLALIFSACRPTRDVANLNSPPKEAAEASTRQPLSTPCINLNTATAAEFIPLDGIGDVLAQRIIDYREHHGRFRRKEEIIIVEGFSEKKYHAIAHQICVE